MAPKSKEGYVASKLDALDITDHKAESSQNSTRKYQLAYFSILTHSYIHLAALYGIYLCFTSAKWTSIAFGLVLYLAAEMGLTAGAHRLWSHRSYKARMPLQIILMVFNTLGFQNTAIYWVRDHRQHHKYCDTDADPHNANRGFFYSHIGWLLTRKSEKVIQMGKTIDMTDIYSNPALQFQKKYAVPFITTVCFVLPTIIPVYFWSESISAAWHINILRYAVNLNASFLVNSAAHMWGFRPYDKTILPAENIFVSWISLGEGSHNFHHVFPWDSQTAELGNNKFNLTSRFIDFFAWVGWAYDLKKVPKDIVKARGERTGDGSNLWGWGDKDLKEEHKKSTNERTRNLALF